MPPSMFNVLFIIFNIVNFINKSNEEELFVPRVVNGWAAKLDDVPYQLALKQMVSRIQRVYATFCGAVIIGPSKILTAAHCFEERGSKCFTTGHASKRFLAKRVAVAGNLYNVAKWSGDSNDNGQWRELQSLRYPRKYKFPRNDIAVGFTKFPFVINAYVAPIPYTTRHTEYQGKCLASGFGRITNAGQIGGKKSSEILLLAHLEVIPTSRCSRIHRRNMYQFVCTDIKLTDVSKGDSGGPLVCAKTGDPKEGPKGILVGIVSGARPRIGTFFTRVSSHARFINQGTNLKPYIIYIFLIHCINVLFLFCFI